VVINKENLHAYYLSLQWRRVRRWLTELGVYPILAYIFAVPLFFALSKLIFLKVEFADWLYFFIAISFVFKLCDGGRGQQLSLIFKKGDFLRVRLIEHFLVALPFIIYLLYETRWLVAGALLIASMLLAFYTNKGAFNRVVPTPFRKMPFEFIIGFRKSFILLFGVILLLAKAIQVDNFYLALFCLGFSFLIYCSYYLDPEKEYFVWIFDMNVNQFLKHKITLGLVSALLLSVPLMIILMIVYPSQWLLIIGVEAVGLLIVISIILAKYSAFPGPLNLPQTILFILSLLFPFILLVVIPLFYVQAKRKLSMVLR